MHWPRILRKNPYGDQGYGIEGEEESANTAWQGFLEKDQQS